MGHGLEFTRFTREAAGVNQENVQCACIVDVTYTARTIKIYTTVTLCPWLSGAQVISLLNRAPSKPTMYAHERLRHSCGVMPQSNGSCTTANRVEELEAIPVAAEAGTQDLDAGARGTGIRV